MWYAMTRHRDWPSNFVGFAMASVIAKSEVLNWISIEQETPDEGVVVLLFHPDASEPVWPGVFEGCTADGYAFSHADGSIVSGSVLAWAEFPGGPE